MASTIRSFLILSLSISAFNLSAEDTYDLRKADSLAFAALESNAPSVNQRANELLNKSETSGPSIYRVNAYTILGIINKNRGFYVTALDYYLKALNAAEQIEDQGRISACLNNIGSVYQLQGNYEQAIRYYNKSLRYEEKLNNPLQRSIRLYNLGECYKEQNNLDLALSYFNRSLLIEKRADNNVGIVYAELGIADIYIRIGRLTDAELVLSKTVGRMTGEQAEESIILQKLYGKLYLGKGKLKEALQAFSKGESLSKKFDIRTHLPELIKAQITIFRKQNNWEASSKKYSEYVGLIEEMNTAQIKNQLDDLNFRNELIKKQLEIELVQEERDLAKKNEQFEKDLRIYGQKVIGFVILLLICSVTVIIYGIRRITRKKQ